MKSNPDKRMRVFAVMNKISFMLIIGEKVAEADSVGVRKQGEGNLGAKTVADFDRPFKIML